MSLSLTLGRALWAAALGEGIRHVMRQSGNPLPHEEHVAQLRRESGLAKQPSVSGGHHQQPQKGQDSMSFELVGDDYGAIGMEELIGDDDFLDSLIEGDDYLIGDELISGDGSSEIIGARARSNKAAKKRAVLQRLAMRNGGAVVNRGLDRRRRYPLGFVPTAVAAATTVQIPSAPQNLYRPERLVIPSDIAFDLGIADIKVGNQSQLVQSVEVPAALFSEVSINTGVTFDTAEVGNQVSVQARNKSAVALEFTAGLVGTIAK